MSHGVQNAIVIRGARTHNLKGIDADIPRHQLVVITGVSGSGKSSLAFDTLFAEGQCRYLESLSARSRQVLEVVPRPDVDLLEGLPPTLCIEQRMTSATLRSTVGTLTEIQDYLQILYARAGVPYCPTCQVPIRQQSPQSIVDQILSVEAGAKVMILAPLVRARKGTHTEVFSRIGREGLVRVRVDGEIADVGDTPKLAAGKPHTIEAVVDRIVIKPGLRDRLDESVGLALKLGDGACVISRQVGAAWEDHLYSSRFVCPQCGTSLPEVEPRSFSFNSTQGACLTCQGLGTVESDSNESVCPDCQGQRLQPLGRNTLYQGLSLPRFSELNVNRAVDVGRDWLAKLAEMPAADPTQLAADRLLREIVQRLEFLVQVGLDYLTIDRRASTLSGGEYQRTRLAGCLGAGLTGVCYVLDEPTIGLHPRDTRRLLGTLTGLRDQGATVVVVEHDLEVIRHADYVLDLGPGAGDLGGEVLAAGTPQQIILNPKSLTGSYLSGRQHIDSGTDGTRQSAVETTPTESSAVPDALLLRDVSIHTLKKVTVELPLRKLICVTGVSGSGKSSLIMEALVPLFAARLQRRPSLDPRLGHLTGGETLQRLVQVDQTPLGRSGRSNPATYSGVWDVIRRVFAKTRDARLRGYGAARFSFNNSAGRCAACHGHGTYRSHQSLLSDLPVVCGTCQGKRFNPATLAIKFRGLSVADVLDLRIKDAAELFENLPQISRTLQTFVEVGLGHLKLGQPAPTLSGGESQRIKLATELAGEHPLNTLFVLDEPTTGLHAQDIARLLHLLRSLVEQKHTVILIEHHMDVIRASDWMIDLGPDGGAAGGEIVAVGRPMELVKSNITTETVQALRESLSATA